LVRRHLTFGYYKFTDLMGPKLVDLLILLALAYVGMGYLSRVLAVVSWIARTNHSRGGRSFCCHWRQASS